MKEPRSPYTDTPTTESASSSTPFELLANERRRHTLQYVHQRTGAVGLDELATQIVDWEQEDTTEVGHMNHEDHHERVVVSLYHAHLPKLADAGVLDYDADRGTVQSGSNARLETVLSTAEDLDLSDTEVPLDAVFDALANARRRTALRMLMTHGDVPLPDLADEIAVTEHDRPLTEIDGDAVLQVYLSLYHAHLPKLADAGLVIYNHDTDFMALTDLGCRVVRGCHDV